MLKNRAHAKQLANVLVFADCGDRVLKRLGGAADEIRVSAGKVLAREGDLGAECFIIAEGCVDVLVGSRKVTTLGRGDSFVEMAIVDGKPRSATLITTTPVRLFAFDPIGFLALVPEFPPMSRRLFQDLSRRLPPTESERTVLA